MAAVLPARPGRLRTALQRVLSRSFPTWVNPGPSYPGGTNTQDSGWLPWSAHWNYWQEGHRRVASPECAAVEAAVSAYAQTVAMLPGQHWKKQPDGGRIEITDSPLANVLFHPNPYQTRSDFLLNQVRALLFRGNCYALAERDDRDRVTALHPLLSNAQPYVDPETRDVYYGIAPTDLTPDVTEWEFDAARTVPARYVWHVRLHTPNHPLIGVTPLQAAYMAITANVSMNQQQEAFFANMSRPSGTLNTEMVLTKTQVDELRARWQEQSSGMNVGGVPILTAGLKWNALSLSAADAQLIEFYKLSIADIARVLRVPLAMIGAQETGQFSSTEVLMRFWVSSGLGFVLEHIELSLDQFFNLPRDEYSELDTAALLRSNFKERIEGIVRAVQGGIYTPNEGRNQEGLPNVEAGDEPRMQQQVVPLSWWDKQDELKREQMRITADAQANAEAAPEAEPETETADDDVDPDADKSTADILRARFPL